MWTANPDFRGKIAELNGCFYEYAYPDFSPEEVNHFINDVRSKDLDLLTEITTPIFGGSMMIFDYLLWKIVLEDKWWDLKNVVAEAANHMEIMYRNNIDLASYVGRVDAGEEVEGFKWNFTEDELKEFQGWISKKNAAKSAVGTFDKFRSLTAIGIVLNFIPLILSIAGDIVEAEAISAK
jgi:hypothetical protein